MLLARRQGQHIAAPALGIHGLAAEPARHLAHMPRAGGEEAEMRAAEAHRIADRLAFRRHDVGPHLPGRLERAQRHDLGDDDHQQRPLRMGGFGELREVPDIAEQVGILDDDAGGVGVDPRCQVLAAGWRGRPGLECEALEARQGRGRVAVMRVEVAGDHRLRAPCDAVRHHHRLGRGGRAVIHGGVGDLHAGEQAHLGLELEQVLQRALGDFRLVGRVGGKELAALDQVVHGGRDVVAVAAGPAEEGARARRPVPRREAGEPPFDLELAGMERQIDGLRQQRIFGHIREQRLHRRRAHCAQHLAAVGAGDRQVAHQSSSSTKAW